MKKLSQKCVAKVGDVARHATSSSSRLIRPSPQREQALVEIRGLSAETTRELVDCFSHRDPKDSKAVKKDFEAYLPKDQNDDVSREVFAKKMIKIYCDESDGRGAGLKLNETAKVASEWSRAGQ